MTGAEEERATELGEEWEDIMPRPVTNLPSVQMAGNHATIGNEIMARRHLTTGR